MPLTHSPPSGIWLVLGCYSCAGSDTRTLRKCDGPDIISSDHRWEHFVATEYKLWKDGFFLLIDTSLLLRSSLHLSHGSYPDTLALQAFSFNLHLLSFFFRTIIHLTYQHIIPHVFILRQVRRVPFCLFRSFRRFLYLSKYLHRQNFFLHAGGDIRPSTVHVRIRI